MPFNIPIALTLTRMIFIPLLVMAYYAPGTWAIRTTIVLFVLAAITDWLDGYLARRLGQTSRFGAFLDPVADKLMVATALVLLTSDPVLRLQVSNPILLTLMVAVIVGREIAVSALREWMAENGSGSKVAVSWLGKLKTIAQMTAIPFLLHRAPLAGLPVVRIGEWLLYLAAILTLWSMFHYLRAAWDHFRVDMEG